jgi:hypothetical protein
MTNRRYNRDLPVSGSYDVVVAGAGPAGLAAAVASARLGARTALVERYGVVGGNLVVGHVGPIMGRVAEGTLADEVRRMLGVQLGETMHDVETAKRLLTRWVHEAGVDLRLQTPVMDAIVANGQLESIVVGGRHGVEALDAEVFVDATGDGALAAAAGAPVMVGRPGDGLVQPVTLMYTVAGVDTDRALYFPGDSRRVELRGERFTRFCERKCAAGELPPNVTVVRLFHSVNPGEVMVNTTQENGIDGLRAGDIVRAELSLRDQIVTVTSFLRKYVPGYERAVVKDSADTLGVRETRRIEGAYVLQDADLQNGRRFEDVVVHDVNFVIDIHNPAGGGQAEGEAAPTQRYDIPYRCFLPRHVARLLTAGRCISGTHRAHASYRVMNICMAMGDAVGTAAALAVSRGLRPHELPAGDVQQELLRKGVRLFD